MKSLLLLAVFLGLTMASGFVRADDEVGSKEVKITGSGDDHIAPAAQSVEPSAASKVEPKAKVEFKQQLVTKDENEGPRDGDGLMCRNRALSYVESCFKHMDPRTENFHEAFEKQPKEALMLHADEKFNPEGKGSDSGWSEPSWEFNFTNQARQDMGFYVKTKKADVQAMIFPRKYVPEVICANPECKSDSDTYVVYLPTGEKVIFDRKTAKPLSGPLSMKNNLKYTGKGVMVTVQNTRMVGSRATALDRPSPYKNGKTVEITKKNHKPCYTTVNQLWTRGANKEVDHFRFATDDGFNNWLKKYCGFDLSEDK